MLARESAATMTPSLKMKASVVVPFAGFTIWIASFWNPSNWSHEKRNNKSIPITNHLEQSSRNNKKHTSEQAGSWNEGGAKRSSPRSSTAPPGIEGNDWRPLRSSFMIHEMRRRGGQMTREQARRNPRSSDELIGDWGRMLGRGERWKRTSIYEDPTRTARFVRRHGQCAETGIRPYRTTLGPCQASLRPISHWSGLGCGSKWVCNPNKHNIM